MATGRARDLTVLTVLQQLPSHSDHNIMLQEWYIRPQQGDLSNLISNCSFLPSTGASSLLLSLSRPDVSPPQDLALFPVSEWPSLCLPSPLYWSTMLSEHQLSSQTWSSVSPTVFSKSHTILSTSVKREWLYPVYTSEQLPSPGHLED